MWPTNEAETIELYKLVQDRLGFRIVHLQSAFPDAILESEDGDQLVVEFEFLSKNFERHNHDPDGCQLIICWVDNWPDAPLPVQALGDCAEMEASTISAAIREREDAWQAKIDHWWAEAERWRIEATRLRNSFILFRQKLLKAAERAEVEASWIPLQTLNERACKQTTATVFVRTAAVLDAQLGEFFGS